MAPTTANHNNRRHGRLANHFPLSQGPVAEGEHVHGVLHLQSGATVDELMGQTWAHNAMTVATPVFSGLTLGWDQLLPLIWFGSLSGNIKVVK